MTDSREKATELPVQQPLRNLSGLRVVGRKNRGGTESMVSVRVVRGLVETLERRGVPRAVFMRSAKLCPEQLASAETRLTRAEVFRLCEVGIDLSADPALGLHWAERPNGCAFNPLSDLIAHSATLRQALDAAIRFHSLLSDDVSIQLSEDKDNVTLRCTCLHGVSSRIQRLVSEMRVVGLLLLLRSFDTEARLERASFEYAAPSYHAEYTRVFAGAERFEQPLTGIVFARALMDAPSPLKDQDMYDGLRAIAERQLSQMAQAPFALRVRDLLLQQRFAGQMDMTSVARSLGLSVRSLRRRLVAEGISYTSLANDALAMLAKQRLLNDRRSIQETAFDMGFSDPSAFHRAFKNWTGTTPNAFRNSRSG